VGAVINRQTLPYGLTRRRYSVVFIFVNEKGSSAGDKAFRP
jgi:hypothetical protein